ncbi:hypothetical protein Avbf_09151 [Armadillidium vulgare]|nr:hypothetical protein Avbf_09151 [Armadillidium vulgare]
MFVQNTINGSLTRVYSKLCETSIIQRSNISSVCVNDHTMNNVMIPDESTGEHLSPAMKFHGPFKVREKNLLKKTLDIILYLVLFLYFVLALRVSIHQENIFIIGLKKHGQTLKY